MRGVQAEDFYGSVRPGLVAMLPRLKRFADVLAEVPGEGKALLGRALGSMLAEQHRYQRGSALDVWVDSSVKCNGLSKSDFDVFSKVGQHCLERGFITEAFAWSDTNGIYF